MDISGKADVDGIVSAEHSDKCRTTVMTDLSKGGVSTTDLQCVICNDQDATERQCAELLPKITLLPKNVKYVRYSYRAKTPTSTKVQILEFRGQYT